MTYGEVANAATHAFYANGTILDFVHPNTGKSIIGACTLKEMQERYPGAELMEVETAIDASNRLNYERLAHGPEEISEQQFNDMLNCLPPMGWKNTGSASSFKMSERIWGNLTSIYASVADKYYVLCDDASLPHHEIIKRCLAI